MAGVLLIDGYEPFRVAMQVCLPRFGHDFAGAEDITGAVEASRAFQVDVILLGVGRSDAAGLAMCRELRRRPEFAGAPVVLMAGGRVTAELLREAMEAGAAEAITKAFAWPDLLAVLNRAVSMRV